VARFEKRVNGPGVWKTPDGVAVVTPERVRHWHDSLAAILERGHRPPLCWSHAKGATPHPDADQEFWRARYNAGKVVGCKIDPATSDLILACESDHVTRTPDGKLVSTAALPDGRVVSTEIEDVSVGVADWTDGDGTTWRDVPIHLACTPLPVWVPEGGQPPFEESKPSEVTQFSTRLYRFASEPPMADEGKKDDAPDTSGGPDIKKVIKKLAEAGITLPDDTTPENLLERLYVACTAVGGGSGGSEPPPAPADAGGEGTFMSTIRQDPVKAFLLARVEADSKTRRLERVAALERRGLPAHRAKKLREEASAVRFALLPSGQAAPESIDRVLDELDGVLPPADAFDLTRQRTPADVREAEPPEGGSKSDAQKTRALADQLARNGRLPERK
jgi:hypothetical protein